MGRLEASLEAQEDGEELDEEVFDPHSLVGQIEATAAREEAEQKLALEMARIEAHNRLEARKLRRRAARKKTAAPAVVPMQLDELVPEEKKEPAKKADEGDGGDI